MTATKQDILTLEDVKVLVNGFYGKVRENELLGPIFNKVIQDRWDTHLQKMYTFWETVLLGNHTYFGSPFPPHAKLPIDKHHFDTWLQLWHATIDEHFEGNKATEAKWRGDKMAVMFLSKLEYFNKNSGVSLI